jgi:hypothetical protein
MKREAGWQLLSELDEERLRRCSEDSPYPKWASVCRLRLLGLPTLDAACVEPGSPMSVQAAAERLHAATGSARLVVRSDGGSERARYYRGGNAFPLHEAVVEAERLLADGRAVIFTEPTNRFTNRLSVNARLDRGGLLLFEVLGAGFDVSDLNRGGITPEIVVRVAGVCWTEYREAQLSDFRVERFDEPDLAGRRRTRRLEVLATEVLPAIGELAAPGAPEDAERWLRAKGYTELWHDHPPALSYASLRGWYDDALAVASGYQRRNWSCLSCSASALDDGRFVYWDIVDAGNKFAIG